MAALKDTINEMIRNLRETTRKNASQDWLKTNLAKCTRMLQGQRELETVSQQILSEMVPLVAAQYGAFYFYDNEPGREPGLRLIASYGFSRKASSGPSFRLGEGMVGQCAVEKERFLVNDVPSDYLRIRSGLGQTKPQSLIVLPVLFEGQVKAVIELASLKKFEDIHLTFLDQLTEGIGIVLNTIAATMRTEALLTQSQSLAQELQQTNAELQEKARLLAEQKKEVEGKNREIEVARQALEEKAEQLALTSKYKSQFLANMSHELRTPLNSLLILARTLSENFDGNLKAKQVEFAKTIYAAGNDLLALINDILDLSKIESGTISLEISEVSCDDIQDYVDRTFRQVAEEKGLTFTVERSASLPKSLNTDSKRLQQVLRNFLSNAIKFTARGRVSLRMAAAKSGWQEGIHTLDNADSVLAFSVSDTGIGIPDDKHKVVFEAFQQVDMTTSRKYGGTGLGLSICREIAHMLGADIQLESELGKGSTFTLYIPRSYVPVQPPPHGEDSAIEEYDGGRPGAKETLQSLGEPAIQQVDDDRAAITPSDRVLLIVEDDVATAKILAELGRECGFRVLVATTGEAALSLLKRHAPHAVTLDLCLPDMEGWVLYERLKTDAATRHLPVLICSVDERSSQGLLTGAYACLVKPISREELGASLKRLREYVERRERAVLLVEDNANQRKSIVELLKNDRIRVVEAATAKEAMQKLSEEPFDCVIMDLRLPDMPGSKLVPRIRGRGEGKDVPIIVYTGKEIDDDERRQLSSRMCSVVPKGEKAPELLLTALLPHLNMPWEDLSKPQRAFLESTQESEPRLAGRTVLIIDDDVRNLFAMTSLLERYGIRVLCAENGREGLKTLAQSPEVDLVLMDLMMPGMDGYETTGLIRGMKGFRSLPIIALTAKAMPADRAKCIDAGASDYIRKPVEVEQLRAVLRVWMDRSKNASWLRSATGSKKRAADPHGKIPASTGGAS